MFRRLFINQEKNNPITWKIEIKEYEYFVQIIDYNTQNMQTEEFRKTFNSIEEKNLSVENLIKEELLNKNFTEVPLNMFGLESDLNFDGEVSIAIPLGNTPINEFYQSVLDENKQTTKKVLSDTLDSILISVPPMVTGEFFAFDFMTFNQNGLINDIWPIYLHCSFEEDMITTFSDIVNELIKVKHFQEYEINNKLYTITLNLKKGYTIVCSPPKVYKRSDFTRMDFVKDYTKLPQIIKQIHRQVEKDEKLLPSLNISKLMIEGYLSIINTNSKLMEKAFPNQIKQLINSFNDLEETFPEFLNGNIAWKNAKNILEQHHIAAHKKLNSIKQILELE
jgi:hypothetical protein